MAEKEEAGANTPSEDKCCSADSAGASQDAASDCCSSGSKWVCCKRAIFVIVMLVAVAVAAHAIATRAINSRNATLPGSQLLSSLAELNEAAVDKDVVFVVLAGDDQQGVKDVAARVEKVVNGLAAKDKKVGFFTMDKDAKAYDHLAAQFAKGSFPCVAVLGIGCTSSGVTGEVTEERLLRAFVLASTPVSGCGTGPACCPSSPGK